jgi:hypothetical protein
MSTTPILIADHRSFPIAINVNSTGPVSPGQYFQISGLSLQTAVSLYVNAILNGTVTVCTFNIESQMAGSPQWVVQGTWDAIANPHFNFPIYASTLFRLNCTAFTGTGSASIFGVPGKANTQAASGGGGGEVTQGTDPWTTQDEASSAVGSPVPSDAMAFGWKDGSGNLQIVSAANPLPTTGSGGGGGTVSQGSAASGPSGGWYVALSDLTNVIGTLSHPIRTDPANITTPLLPSNAAQETGGNLATLAAAITGGKYQVHITDASLAVTGTFWQTTQPVSLASAPLPTNAAQETGGNLATLAGAVSASKVQANITNSSLAVTGTFWQATQPVSGTFWQTTQPVSLASIPALAAGTNTIGSVTGAPATSGGLGLPFSALVSNTATAVKTSAGQVYGWSIGNAANASPVYVQLFNKATGSVTLGTTAPDWVIEVPANGGSNMPPNVLALAAHGTAITIAVTSTRTGSTAVGSGAQITIFYN